MVQLAVPIPSYFLNAVLIVVLELSVMMFGHHVYREYTNASFRRQLLAKQSVPVYGGRKFCSVLSSILLLVICIGIELGFEGQSMREGQIFLHPTKSMLLAKENDWIVDQKWDIHPSEISLSSFLPTPQRTTCFDYVINHDAVSISKRHIRYGMYGKEGCYFFHDNKYSRTHISGQFTWLKIGTPPILSTFRILHPLQSQFSREHGVLTFRGKNTDSEDLEQLSVSFQVDFRDLQNKRPQLNERKVIFSVIKNWNYEKKEERTGMDTIAMILLNDHISVAFQVFPFTDIFLPTVAQNSSSLKLVREKFTLPLFDIGTSSLRNHPSLQSKHDVKHEMDSWDMTQQKMYYALSRMHFGLKDTPRSAYDFSTALVSILDARGGSSEDDLAMARVHVSNSSDTRVNVFALVVLSITVLALVFLKGYVEYLRRKAPFSVHMFSISYIAKLRIPGQKRHGSSKSAYNVNLRMEGENGPVLRLGHDDWKGFKEDL